MPAHDGLDAVRQIAGGATGWLAAGGVVLLEIGHDQRDAVMSLMIESGLVDVRVLADLAGRDRFATACAPQVQPKRGGDLTEQRLLGGVELAVDAGHITGGREQRLSEHGVADPLVDVVEQSVGGVVRQGGADVASACPLY